MIRGILLAAGRGRRVGRPKALLTLSGATFYERALSAFEGASLEVVAVINPEVEDQLPAAGKGEVRVMNVDPDQPSGMFSSVKLGVSAALQAGATGVILLPVDHPLVTSDDIRLVASGLATGAALVVAAHAGRRGHPIGVSRLVMSEIIAAGSTSTLRDIVRLRPERVVEVKASQGVVVGVNTKEDLERVSNLTFR